MSTATFLVFIAAFFEVELLLRLKNAAIVNLSYLLVPYVILILSIKSVAFQCYFSLI